jgi:chaperonin cofactor prefoldin
MRKIDKQIKNLKNEIEDLEYQQDHIESQICDKETELKKLKEKRKVQV